MAFEIPMPTNRAKIKYIFDFTPNDLLVPLDTPLIKSWVHGSSHQFSTARKTPPRIETKWNHSQQPQAAEARPGHSTEVHQLLQHPLRPCSWGTNPAGHGPWFRRLITQLGRLVQTNDYFLFAGLWADHQGLVIHSGDSTKPCRLSNRPGKRAEIRGWLNFFFYLLIFV